LIIYQGIGVLPDPRIDGVTVMQAAKLLALSRPTVGAMIDRGDLKVVSEGAQKPGQGRRLSLESVLAAKQRRMEQLRQQSAAAAEAIEQIERAEQELLGEQ